MAFRFTLDSVLRYRENIEKNEERALERVHAEIARMGRQIAEVDLGVERLYASREAAMARGTSAVELQMSLMQQEAARNQKKSLLHELALLEKKRIHQIGLYREAHRNCEMLTEMRQDQRDSYEHERDRKEQKMLDDVVIARHLQN